MLYHGEDGLHEGDEARVLPLGRDDEHGSVSVADRALRKSFNDDGKIAVILCNKLVEQVAGERVRSEASIVGLVEGVGSVDIGPRPLTTHEVVDVVPHPEELRGLTQQ